MNFRSLLWNVYNVVGASRVGGLQPRWIAPGPEGLVTVRFSDRRELVFVEPSRRRLYRRGYDDRVARVARRYGMGDVFNIEKGDIVLDIGANVGEFAIYAAGKGATVVAVEPDPRNFRALRRNVADIPNITAVNVACSNHDGEVAFYTARQSSNSSLIPSSKEDMVVTVKLRSLTSLLRELSIDQVTLLKMDAQGAEPEVLEGAEPVLGRISKLAIDVGPERYGKPTDAACRAVLARHNFAVSYMADRCLLLGFAG